MNANKELNIIKEEFNRPKDIRKIALETQLELRNAVYEKMDYFIDSFIEKVNLSKDEIEIAQNWRHFVRREFVVYTHLKNHTVFIDTKEKKLYGVKGLLDDLVELIDSYTLPTTFRITLVPYKNHIIYDGLIEPVEEEIDDKEIEKIFNDAKEKNELITSFNNGIWAHSTEKSDWFVDFSSYDASITFVREAEKIGRNDPCNCGSGKKYKKCCGK